MTKMTKNKWIESKYFNISDELIKYVYVRHEGTVVYSTLNISDVESISLGGDIISQDVDGVITLRIKLFDAEGNERQYKIYNSATKKTTEVSVEFIIDKLLTFGLTETIKPEFNVKSLIPTI